MTRQPDLFELPLARPRTKSDQDAIAKRKLLRSLHAVPTGGLVNGMSKAQLRRHAPAKLPKVTI